MTHVRVRVLVHTRGYVDRMRIVHTVTERILTYTLQLHTGAHTQNIINYKCRKLKWNNTQSGETGPIADRLTQYGPIKGYVFGYTK